MNPNPNLYGQREAEWCTTCHEIAVQPDQHQCKEQQ